MESIPQNTIQQNIASMTFHHQNCHRQYLNLIQIRKKPLIRESLWRKYDEAKEVMQHLTQFQVPIKKISTSQTKSKIHKQKKPPISIAFSHSVQKPLSNTPSSEQSSESQSYEILIEAQKGQESYEMIMQTEKDYESKAIQIEQSEIEAKNSPNQQHSLHWQSFLWNSQESQ